MNDIPALLVVTQRPRELTRQQLKELKLLLDQAGYTERHLQTAWRETTNQDIAASVIRMPIRFSEPYKLPVWPFGLALGATSRNPPAKRGPR